MSAGTSIYISHYSVTKASKAAELRSSIFAILFNLNPKKLGETLTTLTIWGFHPTETIRIFGRGKGQRERKEMNNNTITKATYKQTKVIWTDRHVALFRTLRSLGIVLCLHGRISTFCKHQQKFWSYFLPWGFHSNIRKKINKHLSFTSMQKKLIWKHSVFH